jgi:hypothetical protein
MRPSGRFGVCVSQASATTQEAPLRCLKSQRQESASRAACAFSAIQLVKLRSAAAPHQTDHEASGARQRSREERLFLYKIANLTNHFVERLV